MDQITHLHFTVYTHSKCNPSWHFILRFPLPNALPLANASLCPVHTSHSNMLLTLRLREAYIVREKKERWISQREGERKWKWENERQRDEKRVREGESKRGRQRPWGRPKIARNALREVKNWTKHVLRFHLESFFRPVSKISAGTNWYN